MSKRKFTQDEQLLERLVQGNGYTNYVLNDEGQVVEESETQSGTEVSHSEALARFSEKMNRLNAIAGVYERTNRIVTGQEITVNVLEDGEFNSNARTNGKDIDLNAKLIRDLDDESILGLHGVNFHELSHILFSPRAGSDLAIYARNNKLTEALKTLEEARAEQLLVSRYPSTRPFLEANIYLNILDLNPVQDWGKFFHLITGRTYLPLELRQVILDMALAEYPSDIVLEIREIIHAYRNLVFPTQFDEAKRLLERYADITGRDDEAQPICKFPVPTGGTGSGCDISDKGRPAGKSAQEQLQQGKGNERLERTDTNSSANKSEAGKSSGNEAGNGQGDSEAGVSEDTATNENTSAIATMLDDLVERLTNTSEVRQHISDTRRAILDSDVTRVSITKSNNREVLPSQPALSTASRFAQELERLVRDSDPMWHSRTPRGRLNIARTMTPDVNAIGEMFDEWDIGNEATDIEAVILTDNSGSMCGVMQQVCEATWVIKRGIEAINGAVSVYNFESDTHLLYSKEEKAKPRTVRFVQATGGTNPLRGLIEADRLLTTSKKAIKLLFVITDGDWSNENSCNDLIKSMNDKGFLTSVVFIGDMNHYHDLIGRAHKGEEGAKNYLASLRHNAQVFNAVSTVREMLKIATSLVKSSIGKRIA